MKPRPKPWLFWLLLAAASTFFAEVISGASPFAFFTAWGLLVVLPLYGLHTLILAALAFCNGPPRFSTLFFAGMLFGLYEAYITKVLWAPPWFETVKVLGVDLVSFTLLVPYWHTFMSFIVPLLVVEALATSSSSVLANLPRRAQAWLARPGVLYALAFGFGLLQTAGEPQQGQAFISAVLHLTVMAALFWLWRRVAGQRFALAELLPRSSALTVMAVLLATMYIAQGIFLLPENMPSLAGQVGIWLIYALVILAFRRSVSVPGAEAAAGPALFAKPTLWGLAAVYLLAALLGGFFSQDLRNVLFLINTLAGSLFGLAALVYSIYQLRGSA